MLDELERRLRALDEGIDVVLFFVPNVDELRCARAGGTRAEHFRTLCLRRDDPRWLPARALRDGCRARRGAGDVPLLPTDRAGLAVPFRDAAISQAVLYLASSSVDRFISDDALVGAVEMAAEPYAIALEREADRAEAIYDGLTGALTARAFRRAIHDELSWTGAATRRVCSLWFVDTDRFKCVNDEFGHQAGDTVLRAMGALLRAHAAEADALVARNGGDEFCVFLRNVSKSAAIERARRFCSATRERDFSVPIQITASIGVATYPHDAATSSELLEVADAAMYHSKRHGRDRVSYVVAPGRYESLDEEAEPAQAISG